MKIKNLKFASAFLATSLVVTPIYSILQNNQNIAKAYESNQEISSYPAEPIYEEDRYDGWAGSNGMIAHDYLTREQCVDYITNSTPSNFWGVAGLSSIFFKGIKSAGISITSVLLPNFHLKLWHVCKEAARQGKGVFIRYIGVKTMDGKGVLKYPIYQIM